MMALAVNYDYATFSVYERVTDGVCYITLRGYSKLKVGSFKMPSTATDAEIDAKILSESKIAIEPDLSDLNKRGS
jgi:hypothetical protein